MSDIKRTIWDYLQDKGLNDYAAAGVMGNLRAESALNPKNLENSYQKKLGHTDESYTAAVDNGTYTNFVNDKAGYGLAQWTFHARKQGLLNYVKARGVSIGDLGAQLDYLYVELGKYTAVIRVLLDAKSVREASDVFMCKFENPADQSAAVQLKRAAYAQGYYDKFATAHTSRTVTIAITNKRHRASHPTANCYATNISRNYRNKRYGYAAADYRHGNTNTYGANQRYCNRHPATNRHPTDTSRNDCIKRYGYAAADYRHGNTNTYGAN